MSHLIQILTTTEMNTLPYDWNQASYPQILAALQAEDPAVDALEPVRHERGSHLTLWADEEGFLKDRPLNLAASAFAGKPVCGTAVITGFNPRAYDARGLAEDEVTETRSTVVRAYYSLRLNLATLDDLAKTR